MAKVSGPLGSSEARGKVGGIVYNTYRGVATVRAKHAPSQQRSPLQLATRSSFITVTRAWAACQHKLAWDAYAALHPTVDGMGNSIRASGQAWFIALNTRLLSSYCDLLVDPPPPHIIPPITGIWAELTFGYFSIIWSLPSTADILIEFWRHGPHSSGSAGSIKQARLLTITDSQASATDTLLPPPGRYSVFLRPLHLLYGTVGPFQRLDVDVTP